MAVIETKFSVGDTVYHAGTTTERKQHPCPDCKGTRRWQAISPAGSEYSFLCPRCSKSYSSFTELGLDYTSHVPSVRCLTIGSVRHDSHEGKTTYMCRETGVGSGKVWSEADLYPSEAQALEAADIKAKLSNSTVDWVVKLYDQSLEVSDYQLENAALKEAADAKRRAGQLLWNMGDLFDEIGKANDRDEILDLIADYKRRTWEKDKAAATEQVSA